MRTQDTINDFPSFKTGGDTLLLGQPSDERERRRSRSVRMEDALQMCLTVSARRLNLKALVLADDLGLALASAPSEVDAVMLAAWCPLAVGPLRPSNLRGKVRRGLSSTLRPHGGGHVRMRRFGGRLGAFYLCSVGRVPSGSLDEIQRTIERILQTTD